MPKVNLYIDCTNGVSGDMLCQGLIALCANQSFVEEQQQLISDELHHEQHHHAEPAHGHTHRSFQSLLGLLSDCQLHDEVKTLTLKIYTILAAAEAQVHGETLQTVHFHEVGRPQAIINMVGIAAALTTINPGKVYCSTVMDGIGTVNCAHGEITVPVPAVRALMRTSNLPFGTKEVEMEMVTPTGLAALLALEPQYMNAQPNVEHIIQTSEAKGSRWNSYNSMPRGLIISTFI
jgi:uncharacterized protein (DUF111 family)